MDLHSNAGEKSVKDGDRSILVHCCFYFGRYHNLAQLCLANLVGSSINTLGILVCSRIRLLLTVLYGLCGYCENGFNVFAFPDTTILRLLSISSTVRGTIIFVLWLYFGSRPKYGSPL